MKCEDPESSRRDEELRKYCPRSDFCILNSGLPRLLIEVHSTSSSSTKQDLIRMVIMGASIVRFANNFVEAYKKEKSFVLCAIYVSDTGEVTLHTLFQFPPPNSKQVGCASQ
jgi:hypothetical protein